MGGLGAARRPHEPGAILLTFAQTLMQTWPSSLVLLKSGIPAGLPGSSVIEL